MDKNGGGVMGSSTGGTGGKKIGRGLRSPAHARYVNEDRQRKNKIKKLKGHIKKCGEDKVALKCLRGLI